MVSLALTIDALLTGKPALLAPGTVSAIDKRPVAGPVRITWLGLAGDHQADQVHHGGPDKALLLYPQEHYAWWRGPLADHALLGAPGAFGENLATRGADETGLCLGDRFTLGSALVEISHGRQPCYKLNHRFGQRDALAHAVRSGRVGVFLRVLREGEASASDGMQQLARPHPQWNMERIFDLLIRGRHARDPAGLAELARLPVLTPTWRERAEKLAR